MRSMLSVFALFVALVLAQDGGDGTIELVEEVLVAASYDERHERPRNLFEVFRMDDNTIGIDAVLRAQMFTSGEDTFIGTSMYNNYVTFKGPQPILQWNADDEEWNVVGTHPDLRPSSDSQASVSYFKTADGQVWAYDALYMTQNSTVRSTNLVGGNGTSYILKFDGSSFESTPSFSFFTNFSTARSSYFTTSDNREFLWTFSWGPGNAPSPVPPPRNRVMLDNRATAATPQKCTLIEYRSSGWVVAEDRFVGCPSKPRQALSFSNVEGNFVYLVTSSAGPVLTLNYRPSLNPQWEVTNNVLDNFSIPDVDTIYHWVDTWGGVSYDMITATTPSAVLTFRLHWDTHYVEPLPAVRITQGAPYELSWLPPNGRTCFVVGSASYPGLGLTPADIYSWHMSFFCWDQSRDVWDLALRVPTEVAWFNQIFPDPNDEEQWFLATLHKAHLTSSALKTYHIEQRDDDDIHVYVREGTSVPYAESTSSDVHLVRHLSIATVSLLGFVVLMVLLIAFLLSSGGGGGGGATDYNKF